MLSRQSGGVMPFASPQPDSAGPATFRQRGLAVPFTSPRLAAARVRQTDADMEFVLTNPFGKKANYILTWANTKDICAPTVHDTMLVDALHRIDMLAPRAVRVCALTVALEGYAGEAAAAAAQAALAADRTERVDAQFWLLKRMLEQVDPDEKRPFERHSTAFDQRVNIGLGRLAAAFQRPQAQLAAAMGALGEAFGPVGVAHDGPKARMARSIEQLDHVHAELHAWLDESPDHDVGGLGAAVLSSILATARSARSVQASIRQVLANAVDLLRRRMMDPRGVAALAERGFWLLDGWETVCLIWRCAETVSDRRVALLEMAQCLPRLPREAFQWTDPPADLQEPDLACDVLRHDGFTQAAAATMRLIQRNEALLAMRL